MSTIEELQVLRLGHPRPPWLLSALAVRTWAEAAAVCLEHCEHRCGVGMAVRGISDVRQVSLETPEVDEPMRRTHQNLKPAAEDGAVAVVASLIHDLTDDLFIKQAVEHTGIDYWLGRRDAQHFQSAIRIEISGILRENSSNTVEYRLRKKHERLSKYTDECPAKVAIVEFSTPKAIVEDHE
jgi:hypothetical protein